MTKRARKAYMRKWHQRNKASRRIQRQAWRKKNPLAERPALYAWRKKNPDKVRAINRRYFKKRRQRDPAYRVLMALRTRLNQALRGISKSARTRQLLGCTIPEFLLHLESRFRPGMTWENYGTVWEIDHRRPCAWFDLTDPLQQAVCFHYTNLQPLFVEENEKKGSKCPE